jgi:hypothetical protein
LSCAAISLNFLSASRTHNPNPQAIVFEIAEAVCLPLEDLRFGVKPSAIPLLRANPTSLTTSTESMPPILARQLHQVVLRRGFTLAQRRIKDLVRSQFAERGRIAILLTRECSSMDPRLCRVDCPGERLKPALVYRDEMRTVLALFSMPVI